MYATGKFGLLVNLMERPSSRDHNEPVPEIRIWVRAYPLLFKRRSMFYSFLSRKNNNMKCSSRTIIYVKAIIFRILVNFIIYVISFRHVNSNSISIIALSFTYIIFYNILLCSIKSIWYFFTFIYCLWIVKLSFNSLLYCSCNR